MHDKLFVYLKSMERETDNYYLKQGRRDEEILTLPALCKFSTMRIHMCFTYVIEDERIHFLKTGNFYMHFKVHLYSK